jgi:hypothetical protein
MRSILVLLTLSALPLLSRPAPAAELLLRDLQVSLTAAPEAQADVERDDGGDAAAETLVSGELGVRHSFAAPGQALGLVAGLDLLGESDADRTQGSLALRGALGGGWAVTREWVATGEAGLRYGAVRLADDGTAGSRSGELWGWDARVGVRRQVLPRISALAWVGWNAVSEDLDGAPDRRRTGLVIGVGVSWTSGWLVGGVW